MLDFSDGPPEGKLTFFKLRQLDLFPARAALCADPPATTISCSFSLGSVLHGRSAVLLQVSRCVLDADRRAGIGRGKFCGRKVHGTYVDADGGVRVVAGDIILFHGHQRFRLDRVLGAVGKG